MLFRLKITSEREPTYHTSLQASRDLPPYGSLAIQSQPRDPQECNAKRFAVMRALEKLEATTRCEDFVFSQHANV